MRRKFFELLGLAACSLLVAIPITAANKTPTKAAKSVLPIRQSAQSAWPPETLNGRIMMVDPSQRLVIIQTADGVPFDMVIRRSTHIKSGTRSLTLNQLQSDNNKSVSVRFVPERSGDVARSIQILG
jgi:hypothetical protein